MSATRRPGEPLSSEMVKLFRKEAGLSQDEFAEILGLRGGKASVSAWETGRAPCEGPVAELILLRFGRDTGDVRAAVIREYAGRIWNRAARPLPVWRQVVAYRSTSSRLTADTLRKAVPAAALAHDETPEGFPFFDVGGYRAAGLSSRGWMGVVPIEQQRDPQYLWLIDEEGRFLYRERIWEDDAMSPYHGAVAIASVIRLALKTATYVSRLYERLDLADDDTVTLSCEMEGMYDRGFAELSILAHPPLSDRWKESSLAASHRTTARELVNSPLEAGLSLVAATVGMVDADLAGRERLMNQLQTLLKGDWSGPDRALAFVKKLMVA